MENILTGLITTALTEGAKKIQAVPINEGQKARIRTLVLVLSTVGAVAEAYLSGHLETSALIPIVASSAVNFLISTITYHGYKLLK